MTVPQPQITAEGIPGRVGTLFPRITSVVMAPTGKVRATQHSGSEATEAGHIRRVPLFPPREGLQGLPDRSGRPPRRRR